MGKFGKLSLIIVALAAMLCGCTQSNIVSPGEQKVENGQPDTQVRKDIDIDWSEIREDLRDKFLDPYGPFADYVLDLNVKYDNSTGLVTVLLPVTHKTTGNIAVKYAEAALKVVGNSAATQNFYYKAPADDDGDRIYYGSYFDDHNVCVQVFFYDKEGQTDTYLVNDTIKAGEQRAVAAQN